MEKPDTRLSWCVQCRKNFHCEAWEEGYEVTVLAHGMAGRTPWTQVYRGSVTSFCPIDEFEIKEAEGMKG